MPALHSQHPVRPRALLATLGLLALVAAPALAQSGRTPVPDHDAHGFSVEDRGGSFQYALLARHDNMTEIDGRFERRMDRLRDEVDRSGRPLLWFSLEGREYVVRDSDLLARARTITEPMRELGRQQGELGRQQGELGRQQGQLGRRQGEIGVLEGRIGALEARLAMSGRGLDDDERAQRAELRAELESLRSQLRAMRDDAGDLGSRQGDLGARQGELGRRQGELGRRQAAASRRALGELRELARQAIRDGRAERLAEE